MLSSCPHGLLSYRVGRAIDEYIIARVDLYTAALRSQSTPVPTAVSYLLLYAFVQSTLFGANLSRQSVIRDVEEVILGTRTRGCRLGAARGGAAPPPPTPSSPRNPVLLTYLADTRMYDIKTTA